MRGWIYQRLPVPSCLGSRLSSSLLCYQLFLFKSIILIIGYRIECQGVTQIEVRQAQGQQILCHPQFQPNLQEYIIKQNFSINTNQSITLSIDEQDKTKFYYTKDIQIPNCFIVYAYKNSTGQNTSHCLFQSGYPKIGGQRGFYFLNKDKRYGILDDFTDRNPLIECPNQDQGCNACNTPPNYTDCSDCKYISNYITSKNKTCLLTCPIEYGLCDEQNPEPKECNSGTRKVQIQGSNDFYCEYCYFSACEQCTYNACTKCSYFVYMNDYLKPTLQKYLVDGFNCINIDNCIEYPVLADNKNMISRYECLMCNIGYYVEIYLDQNTNKNLTKCSPCDGSDTNQKQNLFNCFHCLNGDACLICRVGFQLQDGMCVEMKPYSCTSPCQTCLLNNMAYCTSCAKNYFFSNNQCFCDESQKLYFEVDGDCKACSKGVCQTCITFYDCLSCNPTKFRYLDGTQCICQDGYYDAANIDYKCEKCHPICKTCFAGDISSCQTCNEEQNRVFIKGMCICAQGYGQNKDNFDDLICQNCYSRCNTCENANDPESCTSCLEEQNRQLAITTECLCNDNYGDNYGEYDVCFICHYSCQYCNGPTEFDCTSCSDLSHRSLAQDFQCKCIKGYLDAGVYECQSCHYSCEDCQNDPNRDQCTECPASREPDLLESVFKCICKDSNYFDDGLNKECQQCHYSCLTCSFYGPSFCKSCDISIRKLKSSLFVCNEKTFDDDISTTCLPCHPSCLTCKGTESTDCSSCSSDVEQRELLEGACICMESYYEDVNTPICQLCSPKCKTCAVTKDLCLSCPPNSFRELGDDQSCSCFQGFFDDPETLSCILCHIKCLTCFGVEQNQCQTCKPLANRYLKDSQCLCMSHYFEVDVEQCSICSSDCLDCSMQYDHCTSCVFGKKLVDNTCQCGNKLEGLVQSTFKMFGEGECQKCHYSCLSCYGYTSDKCINCYEIENRYQNGSKCFCSDGYYDSGVPICQKCGYQCQTCIDTENQCLSCKQNSLRTLNGQIFSCTCNSGYFDDGTNPICQKCDYRCAQCSIRFDHCITCDLNSYRQFNDMFFTCACISGFYDEGNALCKPCHYSCLECTDSGNLNCKSCNMINSLAKWVLYNTQCICQVGFYDDGFSSNCQPCDVTCVQCKNQAYSCITCSTTRTLKDKVCQCKSGYLETGQKDCSLCDKNCLECKFTVKTCSSCNLSLFRVLDSTSKTCICQEGYLEIDSQCELCNTSCLTCSISQDKCTRCKDNRLLLNNQCLCEEGFFESSGLCQVCHKSCSSCQNSAQFCLSCSMLNYRKLTISNTCICIDGYYEQQTTLSCEKCDYSCKTCSGTVSNCTSCDISLNLDIYFNKCVCEQGYYLNQTTNSCQQCHISCLTCDSFSKCTQCRVKTRILNDELDTCDSKVGYFEINQADCQQCNLNCLTCTVSTNNCQTCDPVYLRKLIGNECLCPSGYYDAGIQLCQPCGSKCKTCVEKWNKCTLCYQIEQHRFLNVNTCECLSGYFDQGYDICQKCSIKCKTCVGSDDYCTSCDINQKRLDYSIIHKCPCIQGFYEDEAGECQKCHIKCDGCINTIDNCLNCNGPLKSNRYLLSNQCNCKPGFYDDNIQLECQKCSKICETCLISETNCLSCFGNLRHNPPYCNCLDGYYEDASQNCLHCQNQCQTCTQTENNFLTCKHGRINQICECPKGYFEAGQIDCIKCEFQCSECFQYSTQCTVCRGNRINPLTCICEDGYYDDGVNEDCQQCDFRCKTCNLFGCLTCNGNRIISNEQTCDPPQNSISYETTPWCSNCEVAVLLIRFSDDLNQIDIKFDFRLKPIQEVNQCNQILEDETLNLIGTGYNCNLDQFDNSIFIIVLGQESTVIVDNEIKLKSNILQHVECQSKVQTFIFNTVQVSINILEPIIIFNVPNYKISSCVENIISPNYTNRDGKRRLTQIQWDYKIINQENKQELDDLVQNLNVNQEVDIIIPAQTLPESSQITLFVQISNFLGTSSSSSFDLNTLSSISPYIETNVKSYYFNYQINFIEINKSNITAASSKINLSYQSIESQYSVSIPKFSLTPKTTYYFKINVTEMQSQESSQTFFSFEIKPAELLCQFINLVNVQDFRKDLSFHIQCKDNNVNYDWNLDPQLNIEVSCTDLFTQSDCVNLQKQKLVKSQDSFDQKVPKYSVKPYTVLSWQVFAQKEDSNKTFEQIIVFLEDSFEPLQIDHNVAYKVRPINNYELLNFTYSIPILKKDNIVEMSLSIICDFSIIQILQPKFYTYQMQLQNYINEIRTDIKEYNLKFSVQYSTSINPSQYNLPLTLNIPPICSKFKQTQSNILGVTQLNIVTYCTKSDDSPYYYKVGYFLTETDQFDYQNGNSKLIFGQQLYQKSPKLNVILPNSFLNNSVQIMISIMDQGGSITNLYGKTDINKQIDCAQQNSSQIKDLELNILIPLMFQSLGQVGSQCEKIKSYYYQQLLSKSDLSNDDLSMQMKAIKVYKNYSTTQQEQLRLLNENSFKFCIDSETNNFFIDYSPNNQKISTQSLLELQQDNQKFEKIVNILINLSNQLNLQLKAQGIEWDQDLFDQLEEIQKSLKFSLLIADNILAKLKKFNQVDDQIYKIYMNLQHQIDLITLSIQEKVLINENPEVQEGEIMIWKLQRYTRQQFNEILRKPTTIDDEIIKSTQKEYLELKFNPLMLTNSTIQKIQGIVNSSNILLNPTKLIQTQIKNFRSNGQFLVQQQLNEEFGYQMNLINNCSKEQFTNAQYKKYSALCYAISDKEQQCRLEVNNLQNQQASLNCICSSFGQILIVFKQIENSNISSNLNNQMIYIQKNLIFDYEKINVSSPIFIVSIIYIGLISIIYFILLFKKQNKSELTVFETDQDKLKEQIKIYPGNFRIFKQNFKFIHQLLSPFYFKDLIISKSFYFIDINLQYSIKFLSLLILTFNLGSYQSYVEIIITSQIGMAFRMISKLFQGIYRLNNVFKILIQILAWLLFLGDGFVILVLLANSTYERNLSKLFDFLIGIIIYEVINEPMLIFSSIIGYKITFASIQLKEFKAKKHLIYYFAYHQQLDEVFKQYKII